MRDPDYVAYSRSYAFLDYQKHRNKLELLYSVFSASDFDSLLYNIRDPSVPKLLQVNPNFLEWISILKARLLTRSSFCNASSYNACTSCNCYPSFCGSAIVYLRVFPHKREKWALKIGISFDILRPLAQASPFALIALNIPRRTALFIETKLSEFFKKRIVRNPSGRLLWPEIITRNLWDGTEEARVLIDELCFLYEKIRIKASDIYKELCNPLIFLPTKHFATDLPSWIEKLPILEIKKMISRDPFAVSGEVVANRGALLVLEHGDNFWIFEPNERRVYLINRFVGDSNLRESHMVIRKLLLKKES